MNLEVDLEWTAAGAAGAAAVLCIVVLSSALAHTTPGP
jgi:hypothetical protein